MIAIVHDGAEVDMVVWTVTAIMPEDFADDPSSLLPIEAVFYPPVPNPINSSVNISFSYHRQQIQA